MREAQEKATRPGVSSSPALGDQSPPAELEQTLRVAARFDVAKRDGRNRALGCAEGVRIAAVDGHPCQADRDQLSGRFSPSRQGLPVRSALEPAPMSTGRPDEGRGAGRRRRQDGKAPPRPRDAFLALPGLSAGRPVGAFCGLCWIETARPCAADHDEDQRHPPRHDRGVMPGLQHRVSVTSR